jgi:hypothetical protein
MTSSPGRWEVVESGEGGWWRVGVVGGREPVSKRLWKRRTGDRQRSAATQAAPVWSAVSIRRGTFHGPCLCCGEGLGGGRRGPEARGYPSLADGASRGWEACRGVGGTRRRGAPGSGHDGLFAGSGALSLRFDSPLSASS